MVCIQYDWQGKADAEDAEENVYREDAIGNAEVVDVAGNYTAVDADGIFRTPRGTWL